MMESSRSSHSTETEIMQQVNKSYAFKLLLLSQTIMVLTQHNNQEQQSQPQESLQMETEKLELRNLLEQQLLLNSASLQAPNLPASKQNSAGNNKQLVQVRTHEYDNDIDNGDINDALDDDLNYDDDDDDSFSYNAHKNSFYDHYGNGAYAYGYSLPQGVRRFERGYYPSGRQVSNSMIIEGFYTQLRDLGNRKLYELRCYTAGNQGYRAMRVQYLRRPPVVRRHILPNVNCFDKNI